MKKIDWSTYKFRASQCYKLKTGKLPDKINYQRAIDELINERDANKLEVENSIKDLKKEQETLKNKDGNTINWTKSRETKLNKLKQKQKDYPNGYLSKTKEQELEKLVEKQNTPYFQLLPKTMTSELKIIWRSEKFNRNFNELNDYVEKGLKREELGITDYQKWLEQFKERNIFFKNNKVRLSNEYVTGEADLTDTNDFSNCNEGFDIKCVWSLKTMPFKDDKLKDVYETQNQVYMWLSGAKKWTTASVLVNITENLLHKKKEALNAFYDNPIDGYSDAETKAHQELVKARKELEKKTICDYDAFVNEYPYHQMDYTRDEWMKEGNDIPLKHRVVEIVSEYNQSLIDDLKERIEVGREYLMYLDENN